MSATKNEQKKKYKTLEIILNDNSFNSFNNIFNTIFRFSIKMREITKSDVIKYEIVFAHYALLKMVYQSEINIINVQVYSTRTLDVV